LLSLPSFTNAENNCHLSLEDHPTAAHHIYRDFYVDDFISGAGFVKEESELQKTVCHLLASAGMNLRKWRTNSAALREIIP